METQTPLSSISHASGQAKASTGVYQDVLLLKTAACLLRSTNDVELQENLFASALSTVKELGADVILACTETRVASGGIPRPESFFAFLCLLTDMYRYVDQPCGRPPR